MKLLGLNSPEIFIILIVILAILGPKRIEKGFLLFQKIIKFLLSKDGTIEAEEKSENPKETEVKEEIIEAEVKSEKPEETEVKEEIIEAEVKSEIPEEIEVKEEKIEVKEIRPKKKLKKKQ